MGYGRFRLHVTYTRSTSVYAYEDLHGSSWGPHHARTTPEPPRRNPAETAPPEPRYRNGTSPIARRSLRVRNLSGWCASFSIARTAHMTWASFELE